MLRQNLLRDRITVPGDVGIHLIQSYRQNNLPNQGVFPDPLLLVPWLFTQDPPRHPILESPHQPPDAQGHNPSICDEDQYGLK